MSVVDDVAVCYLDLDSQPQLLISVVSLAFRLFMTKVITPPFLGGKGPVCTMDSL